MDKEDSMSRCSRNTFTEGKGGCHGFCCSVLLSTYIWRQLRKTTEIISTKSWCWTILTLGNNTNGSLNNVRCFPFKLSFSSSVWQPEKILQASMVWGLGRQGVQTRVGKLKCLVRPRINCLWVTQTVSKIYGPSWSVFSFSYFVSRHAYVSRGSFFFFIMKEKKTKMVYARR